MNSSNENIKILFKLEIDVDGYPPMEWEKLWAKHLGNELYEIDNIPFFVKDISIGDIVSVTTDDDCFLYSDTVYKSKHSTFRILLKDISELSEVKKNLDKLGCSIELCHISELIAVDVPENVDIAILLEYLKAGIAKGRWECEEGALRHE